MSYKYRCCIHNANEDSNHLFVESKTESACGVHSSYRLNFYSLSLPASGYIRSTCSTGSAENTMPHIHSGCTAVCSVCVCGGMFCLYLGSSQCLSTRCVMTVHEVCSVSMFVCCSKD